MTVFYKGKFWTAYLRYETLKNLQKNNPNLTIKLTELTESTYKKEVEAPVGELNDWSVERNLFALGLN